jgi:hypothetical protein
LKQNAAEIAAPLSPRERSRLHHRYLRQRARWLAEIADGDPLGLAGRFRKDGDLADLQRAIMMTAPVTLRTLRPRQAMGRLESPTRAHNILPHRSR